MLIQRRKLPNGFGIPKEENKSMATAGQIQFRLKQAKKKLVSLNTDVTAQQKKVKSLESQLKTAKKKPAKKKVKAKAKKKRAAPRRKAAKKR